jgi:hypothetical protein
LRSKAISTHSGSFPGWVEPEFSVGLSAQSFAHGFDRWSARRAHDVVESLAAVDLETLDPPKRFAVLDRLETARRRQVAVAHSLVARLEQFEGCPPVPITLADMLRISPREAKRRIRDAEQLAPRTALTGAPLRPLLAQAAAKAEAAPSKPASTLPAPRRPPRGCVHAKAD